MARISVLGSGRVGAAIVLDLLESGHDVQVADLQRSNFNRLGQAGAEVQKVDLSKSSNVLEFCESADLVVSAVPGFLGFETLRAIIQAKKSVVDISFFPEDPFQLDELAKTNGVSALVDCGVAPGLDNIVLGRFEEEHKVQRFSCMVGGLPLEPVAPWFYKAPFSPIDVIEEYTRPARFVEGGKLVVKEALTDLETIDFPGLGQLEAFNSDGLRTLIRSFPEIPNMIEKTLRYPGHVDKILTLKESGFFQSKKISGTDRSFLDVSSELLFEQWQLEDGEKELTAMVVEIVAEDIQKRFRLLDYYDEEKDLTSMARTTGYTCTAAVNLLLNGGFEERGIIAPEYLGKRVEHYDLIMGFLEERGVVLMEV